MQLVFDDFIANTLLLGVLLVEAHTRNFRVYERGPGDDGVVDLEFLEVAEQGVDCRMPSLVRRRMGELIGSGNIACGKDVGIDGLQVFVGLDRALGWDAEFLQSIATEPGDATDSTYQDVELDRLFLPFVLHHQGLASTGMEAAQGLVSGEHPHPVGEQRLARQFGHFDVLADHDPRRHLDLCHLGAQATERLRQLAANRPAAEHHHAFGQLLEFGELVPQGVAGDIAHAVEAGQGRDERPGSGSDHDVAGGQHLLTAVFAGDLDRPRIDDLCIALHHVHA